MHLPEPISELEIIYVFMYCMKDGVNSIAAYRRISSGNDPNFFEQSSVKLEVSIIYIWFPDDA